MSYVFSERKQLGEYWRCISVDPCIRSILLIKQMKKREIHSML